MSKKLIQQFFVVFLCGSLFFGNAKQAEARIHCPPVADLAADMGLDLFDSMTDWIPFMSAAKARLMGKFFSKVLDNPEVSKAMMECTKTSRTLAKAMITTMKRNPWLLDKTARLMTTDHQLAESLLGLALVRKDISKMLFGSMNPLIYQAMTYSMLHNPKTVQHMAEILKKSANKQMKPGTRFNKIFYDLGTVEDSDDGMEMANERLLFALLSDLDAGAAFLDTLDSFEPAERESMIQFLFFGKHTSANGEVKEDSDQKFRFIQAMVRGLVISVVPAFDPEIGLDPESDNKANVLMARLIDMMQEGQGFNETGIMFVKVMLTLMGSPVDPIISEFAFFMIPHMTPEMLEQIPEAFETGVEFRDFKELTENVQPGSIWNPRR